MKVSLRQSLFLSSVRALSMAGLMTISLTNGLNFQRVALAQPPHPANDDVRAITEVCDPVTSATYPLEQVAAIPLSQAIQTAETFAKSQAFNAELEWKNGRFIYSVEVGDQEIVIDANSGIIIFTKVEDEAVANLQQSASITLQQAIQTAESLAHDRAYSAELEEETIGLVYAVEVNNQEIYIDAGDGSVLYIEVEEQEPSNPLSRNSVQAP